jgi:hypothetical protein
MELVTPTIIRSSLGYEYQDEFVFLPAVGSSGGILLAVNSSFMHLTNQSQTSHTISATVQDMRRNINWMFT